MEDIKLITIIISIATAMIALFNNRQKKGETLQDEYFNSIILNFFEVKRANPNMDTLEYIKKYRFKKCCIPNYIFYLADNNKKEELEKVLKVDYWDNYPHIFNDTDKTIDKLMKIGYFIEQIVNILMGGFIIALLVASFLILGIEIVQDLVINKTMNISNILKQNSNIFLGAGLLFIMLIIIYVGTKRSESTFNKYTSNENAIKKIIDNKIKRHDKLIKENYL